MNVGLSVIACRTSNGNLEAGGSDQLQDGPMPDQRFGEFDDLVEMTPEPLRPVTVRLKELLLSVDPDACIVVRLGDRAATFGIGPRKMSEGYCYILPYSNWVNLGFYRGADISDPEKLLQGTGSRMRHIKVRSIEECDNPRLVAMIREALEERKAALGVA
ncbi:MAG: DUF1801 domain-containing protein [Boseongicola sp. SB0662_bin_57]|nr:DUF1801 domain-containing protein [Boseongicola sp. SB0662_bin_57]